MPPQDADMPKTDKLRAQHDAAATMIDRLLKLAETGSTYEQAYCLALQVAKLTSLLRVHFAHEDCTVYATLFDCGDPDVSRIALDYFQELGGLADRVVPQRLQGPRARRDARGPYRSDAQDCCLL